MMNELIMIVWLSTTATVAPCFDCGYTTQTVAATQTTITSTATSTTTRTN